MGGDASQAIPGRWLDSPGTRTDDDAIPVDRSPPEKEVRMELALSTYDSGDHTVLEVGGEVDVNTAPRLRDRLVDLVEQGARHVVVDLSRVEILDSTGLGVLVGALKRLRAVNGTFKLDSTHEQQHKNNRITALDRVFELYD